MTMLRRSFLALGGMILVGGAALGLPLTWRSERDLIGSLLRKHLPDLQMGSDDLNSFSADFLEAYKLKGRSRRERILQGARITHSLPDGLAQVVLPGAIKTPLARLERELFHAFFLGTDYFDVYQDPAQTVTYFFIPDPYEVGCANNLAQFDEV